MDVDLNDVAVFNEVVVAGSFTAAGQRLGLPTSAVSRRIARLEKQIGSQLFNRTTRKVGLTQAGRLFHEHSGQIRDHLERAAQALHDMRASPTGLIRIAAPPDDGGVIWGLIQGFATRHPKVDIELIHSLDYVDLIRERIDVALRGGALDDMSEHAAHKLFDSRILLVASPGYLAARGTPERVTDLEKHDCIAMDTWAPNAIRRLDGDRGPVRLRLRNRVRVNHLGTVRQAALAGLGVAPLLAMTCWRDLERGDLVEVLRGALPDSGAFWAVHPTGRKISRAARALVEHMVAVAPSLMPPAPV